METARELISSAVVVGFSEQRLSYLAEEITRRSAHYCAVLADNGRRLVGLICFSDVAARSSIADRILSDLMSPPPAQQVRDSDPADKVQSIFVASRLREIAVTTASGDFAGLITAESFASWLLVREQQLRVQLKTLFDHQARLMDFLERKVNLRIDQISGSFSEFETMCLALSHDIRAPLRTIRGYAEIVLGDHGADLPDSAHEMIARIVAVATKGQTVAQDLLSQARETVGAKARSFVAIDLAEVVEDGLQFLDAQIQSTGAKVVVREPLHRVSGYYTGVLQVFVNLLSNAMTYVPPERRPEITVWTEAAEEEVRIYLQDNGIGLEPDQAKRPFDSGVPTAQHGTGLGLHIVRHAIAALGGRFNASSQPGQGTLFIVTLKGDGATPKNQAAGA